jgi:hypothetical protein
MTTVPIGERSETSGGQVGVDRRRDERTLRSLKHDPLHCGVVRLDEVAIGEETIRWDRTENAHPVAVRRGRPIPPVN